MAMSMVDAAKQGDDLAFEGLLEPLLEPGYRLACAMLHDNQAAEQIDPSFAMVVGREVAAAGGNCGCISRRGVDGEAPMYKCGLPDDREPRECTNAALPMIGNCANVQMRPSR